MVALVKAFIVTDLLVPSHEFFGICDSNLLQTFMQGFD